VSWLRELLNRTKDPAPMPVSWVRVRHIGQPGSGAFQYQAPDGELRIMQPGETGTLDHQTFLCRAHVLARLD
jgi:hypothetical protein